MKRDQTSLDDHISAVKASLTSLAKDADNTKKIKDTFDLLRKFKYLRDAYEEIDSVRKDLYNNIEFLSKTVIPDRLDSASGGGSIVLKDIGAQFVIGTRENVSMVDKEAGMAWLAENGYGDLVTETVNASTLTAFAKDLLKTENLALPEDKFKHSSYRYTSIRKAG